MSSDIRITRTLRAEWTKLRSVPSTTWTAIAVVGVTVGVTAFLTAMYLTLYAFTRLDDA